MIKVEQKSDGLYLDENPYPLCSNCGQGLSSRCLGKSDCVEAHSAYELGYSEGVSDFKRSLVKALRKRAQWWAEKGEFGGQDYAMEDNHLADMILKGEFDETK